MGELGFILFTATGIAYGIRVLLSNRVVEAQPLYAMPGRQFKLELSAFVLSGVLAALALLIAFEFPLEISGIKMIIGFGAMGLFAAVDLSLVREYRCIRLVLEQGETTAPPLSSSPLSYSPMTRDFSLLAVAIMLVVTLVTVLVVMHDVWWLSHLVTRPGGEVQVTPEHIKEVQMTIVFDVVFVMLALFMMTLRCIFSYSRNLKLLFGRQTQVLEAVSNGELDVAVPVVTNNEFGVIAGHTNTMIAGLKERLRLKRDMQVAQNIQQAFLPRQFPAIPGLDCWGGSVFSDETGGDYFDFLENVGQGRDKLGVVIGDVTGHGVGAAVFMASARSVFRLRMGLPGEVATAVADVNAFIAHDSGDTGNFITLFYCQIDPATMEMLWVACGHDPALVYRHETGEFDELRGEGIALGIVEDWEFTPNTGARLHPGDVLVLGTDGIWEAESPAGEWYGKERLREVVAAHAGATAKAVGDAVLLDVARFRGQGPQADDITLLVVKASSWQ